MDDQPRCPRCNSVGSPVSQKTVQAILVPDAAAAFPSASARFCRTQTCEVLYYAADGAVAEKSAARVRVGLKESEDPVPLCYCFGFSRADVRKELEQSGTSTIPARITAEVQARRCSCEVKNPAGVCCLGEVNKAVKAVMAP